MNTTDTLTLARNYADALEQKFASDKYVTDFQVTSGAKWAKISYAHGTQRSVHAFVDLTTGRLHKPASWNKASGTTNYDLTTEFDLAVYAANHHGGYLYAGADEAPRAEYAHITTPVADDHQLCTGTCGQILPLVKFPTTAKGGRGTECRKDRDARRAAAKK